VLPFPTPSNVFLRLGLLASAIYLGCVTGVIIYHTDGFSFSDFAGYIDPRIVSAFICLGPMASPWSAMASVVTWTISGWYVATKHPPSILSYLAPVASWALLAYLTTFAFRTGGH
jgi:hypothetical protein